MHRLEPYTINLLTLVQTPDGVSEVVDFMTFVDEPASDQERSELPRIVRRAKCIRGEVRFQMLCEPRFDYARASHQIKQISEMELLFLPDSSRIPALRLRTQAPLRCEGNRVVSDFVLKAGEKALFVLELDRGGAEGDLTARETESFKATLNFWHDWIGRSNYAGR